MSDAPDIFGKADEQEMKDMSYIDDYQAFLKRFDSTQTSGAEIGEVIARMANHFARYNLMMSRSLKLYHKVAKDCYAQIDGNGRPISAAKAEVVANATPEAAAYHEARVHVQNIEQNINALKALQRGILQEYSHGV